MKNSLTARCSMAAIACSLLTVATPAAAQFVLGGPSDDDAFIMCKAYVAGSNIRLGSGEVANNPKARERFRYWTEKHAEETGQKLNPDCESYTRITPDWRATWDIGTFVNDDGETITVQKATYLPDDWATAPTPKELEDESAKAAPAAPAESAEAPKTPARSAAQIAAEERAARAAEREAANKRQREEYERVLAEHEAKLKAFEEAQQAVAETKAKQAADAAAAAEAFRQKQEAYFATIRQHDAEVAQYEREVAAQKILKDFDERNGLGKASTDTDANRCVTTPETQLNASFKGNTAASVMNGCGQPVDVRICLMTTKGWNCGVTWGLASQAKWSFSSFDATGPLFVDAKTSGSAGSLRSPQ